jgi:hypothetical protein
LVKSSTRVNNLFEMAADENFLPDEFFAEKEISREIYAHPVFGKALRYGWLMYQWTHAVLIPVIVCSKMFIICKTKRFF